MLRPVAACLGFGILEKFRKVHSMGSGWLLVWIKEDLWIGWGRYSENYQGGARTVLIRLMQTQIW